MSAAQPPDAAGADAAARGGRRRPWLRFLWTTVVVLAGAALAYVDWQARQQRAENRNRELVSVVDAAGHTYSLYFHRGGDYYNTIRKDDDIVFDSRDHPELRTCLQELVVIDGVVHRRCYLSIGKTVVTAALP